MSKLMKTINGTFKNTVHRSDRERSTHGGLGRGDRRVLDEIPAHWDDKVASTEQDSDPEEKHARRLDIVRAQIRERYPDENTAALIERRLFYDDAYVTLAKDSGVPENTLRSWVSRVRGYLQIPKTNSDSGEEG